MSNCEQANDKIIDRVTGNLGDAEGAELDRHLATCAECRGELARMETVWGALADVDAPAVPPAPLVSEVATAAAWPRPALAAASLVVGLLGGYMMGNASPSTEPAPVEPPPFVFEPPPETGTYLALLRQDEPRLPPGAPMESTLVREYGEWATGLAVEDRLIAAERLNDYDKAFLGPAGQAEIESLAEVSHISGFFVIRAMDFDDAKTTLMSIPHLKYGGWVELREVMREP